jgi:protoporphyrinogen oxidase
MTRAVVVGGGIAGMYAALLLRKKHSDVVLIEAGKGLGGLLDSWQNDEGDFFDFGTHFISGTQIPEIDQDVIPERWHADWLRYDNEHAGNFFGDRLTNDCVFVNLNNLPGEVYSRAAVELLNAPGGTGNEKNLEEQLQSNFGPTVAKAAYAPAMKKFFGVGLDQLVPNAHLLFGMRRVVAFTPATTSRLKTIAEYDNRIAFHSFKDGSGSRPQFYPKGNGVGDWAKKLEDSLREMGVEILVNSKITSIIREGNVIKKLIVNEKSPIECAEMVWTVPLPSLFQAAGIGSKSTKVQLRRTTLANFVFDKRPLASAHFFYNFDPNYSSFRVTLYSNFQMSEDDSRHRVTVEVLSDADTRDEDISLTKLLSELKAMKVISDDAQCSYQRMFDVPGGFPVLTPDFVLAGRQLAELASESFGNLTLAGKATGDAWFMVDVLKDIYHKMATKA